METDGDILDTSNFIFSGDFDQQVSEVLQNVRLQRSKVEQLEVLYRDLHNALSTAWTDIQVMGFGSIVTGLGIKTSDVDCYVELPHWLHPPTKSLVMKAKNILMQYPHIFQCSFAIVNAKVPIVQFYHTPTKMYCDVSFTSSAGVQNSKLIGHLLQTDNRAFTLAILVKYWSKVHNLTGTNLMSNYCLTLLVIFFLQQINILEPVVDLQTDAGVDIVDGWNTAFCPLNRKSDDSNSLYQLLGGFFKYYRTFEYDKYVVSPYVGRPINRELFEKVETVPLIFSQYKSNVGSNSVKPIRLDTVLCVQDPFQHNRNCAVGVYPKLLQRVLLQVQTAVAYFESGPEESFLKNLLSSRPKNDVPRGKKRPPLAGVKKNYRRNLNISNFKQNARNFRQNNYRSRNQWNWR